MTSREKWIICAIAIGFVFALLVIRLIVKMYGA